MDDDNRVCFIKLSGNRPTITPATHPIVGTLSDWRNLDYLIMDDTGSTAPGRIKRKGIVFHDRVEDAVAAKNFQDSHLPAERRGKGVIRHYNSLMLDDYLTQVYDDFRDPHGVCEILHATEAASTVRRVSWTFLNLTLLTGLQGLDIRDIHWVVQYGLPCKLTVTQQRGGRCGRDGITPAIFIIMFEPWALEAKLKEAVRVEAERKSDLILDPDRPVKGRIGPKTPKCERIGLSVLRLVQRRGRCVRGHFATYNNDETPPSWCTGEVCQTKIEFFSILKPVMALSENGHWSNIARSAFVHHLKLDLSSGATRHG